MFEIITMRTDNNQQPKQKIPPSYWIYSYIVAVLASFSALIFAPYGPAIQKGISSLFHENPVHQDSIIPNSELDNFHVGTYGSNTGGTHGSNTARSCQVLNTNGATSRGNGARSCGNGAPSY